MKKKKRNFKINRNVYFVLIALIFLLVFGFKSQIKRGLAYSIPFLSEFFHDYDDENYVFGIDVSHYQEKIDWEGVIISKHPVKFVFIRATMGSDRKDQTFKYNWKKAKKVGLIRGAYHYYDPHENSTIQAQNFIESVKLKKWDFPPVLDIEELSDFGNKNLHKGLKNWLKLIEKEYGVKPILYSGYKYYKENLMNEFSDYTLWVAAYSRSKNSISSVDWKFHQFTDKVKIYGIRTYVDGNDFNGTIDELQKMVLR